MALKKTLFWNLHGVTEENHKTSVRIASLKTET
jgi:hypothetical protein